LSEFVWTFPGGKLVQEVTSLTLVNNTAKTVDKTVPSGKRWILLAFRFSNPDDVARTLTCNKYKEAGKTNYIKRLTSNAAVGAASWIQFPNVTPSVTAQSQPTRPFEVLEAGNTLSFVWATGGASAGGTDADGLVLEYLEMDI